MLTGLQYLTPSGSSSRFGEAQRSCLRFAGLSPRDWCLTDSSCAAPQREWRHAMHDEL